MMVPVETDFAGYLGHILFMEADLAAARVQGFTSMCRAADRTGALLESSTSI